MHPLNTQHLVCFNRLKLNACDIEFVTYEYETARILSRFGKILSYNKIYVNKMYFYYTWTPSDGLIQFNWLKTQIGAFYLSFLLIRNWKALGNSNNFRIRIDAGTNHFEFPSLHCIRFVCLNSNKFQTCIVYVHSLFSHLIVKMRNASTKSGLEIAASFQTFDFVLIDFN